MKDIEERPDIADMQAAAGMLLLQIIALQHPSATRDELRATCLAEIRKAPGTDAAELPRTFDEHMAFLRDPSQPIVTSRLLDQVIPPCGKKLRDCTAHEERLQAVRWLLTAALGDEHHEPPR
jgi:hypothetical protein